MESCRALPPDMVLIPDPVPDPVQVPDLLPVPDPVPCLDLGVDPGQCAYDSSGFNSDGWLHADSCAIGPKASLF